MNKNAYEIRLDVLEMAHNTLMSQYHKKIDALRDNACRMDTTFDVGYVTEYLPSAAAVMEYATELYKFVEGK